MFHLPANIAIRHIFKIKLKGIESSQQAKHYIGDLLMTLGGKILGGNEKKVQIK